MPKTASRPTRNPTPERLGRHRGGRNTALAEKAPQAGRRSLGGRCCDGSRPGVRFTGFRSRCGTSSRPSRARHRTQAQGGDRASHAWARPAENPQCPEQPRAPDADQGGLRQRARHRGDRYQAVQRLHRAVPTIRSTKPTSPASSVPCRPSRPSREKHLGTITPPRPISTRPSTRSRRRPNSSRSIRPSRKPSSRIAKVWTARSSACRATIST